MILLLGGTGYVGQAFGRHLRQLKIPVLEVSAKLLLTGGKGGLYPGTVSSLFSTEVRRVRPSEVILLETGQNP